MKAFHVFVRLACGNKVKDTQCGFKLVTRETAKVLFSTLHLHRWAFDVELVYLCNKLGIPIAEVAVRWEEIPGSKLVQSKFSLLYNSASMLRDMFWVKVCYPLKIWQVQQDVQVTAQ